MAWPQGPRQQECLRQDRDGLHVGHDLGKPRAVGLLASVRNSTDADGSISTLRGRALRAGDGRAMVREAGSRPSVVQLVPGLLAFQHSRTRARQAVRDVFVVLAAFALLGAQALSTLHYVLVPHHLCAEHGVLEDGGARAQSAAPDPTRHSAATEASDQGEQDDHEACCVATRHEQGLELERPALPRASLTQPSLVSAGPGVSLELTRAALLSRAPKTSPPTRA